jgi:hypothetical protein
MALTFIYRIDCTGYSYLAYTLHAQPMWSSILGIYLVYFSIASVFALFCGVSKGKTSAEGRNEGQEGEKGGCRVCRPWYAPFSPSPQPILTWLKVDSEE